MINIKNLFFAFLIVTGFIFFQSVISFFPSILKSQLPSKAQVILKDITFPERSKSCGPEYKININAKINVKKEDNYSFFLIFPKKLGNRNIIHEINNRPPQNYNLISSSVIIKDKNGNVVFNSINNNPTPAYSDDKYIALYLTKFDTASLKKQIYDFDLKIEAKEGAYHFQGIPTQIWMAPDFHQ